MGSIILDKIVVKETRVDYFFSIKGNLQKYFRKENHMFLEYNYDISDIPHSILAIPFVSNVIPLVWITDSTIFVNELDQAFYDCLDRIRAAYQSMYPRVRFRGKIVFNRVINNIYSAKNEAAQLFSGGVDALATFIRIKDKKPFLITEYGWHENDIQKSTVWDSDKENVTAFAKSNGLENILIQSNYGTFMLAKQIDWDFARKLGDNWWHGLHHGLAIISAAIPAAFKLKVKCIYIASSFYKGYKATCASDPTVDNEIRFASGVVFHDAYELTRQDKVKVITDHCSDAKQAVRLRVCFKNDGNCCACEKCLRTIVGIAAEGKNPADFDFDIPADLSQHLKDFLKENVKFFTHSKIMAWNLVKQRMKENSSKVLYKQLLDWFLDYDFEEQRKKTLFKYRVTKFFPILKRKINIRLNKILTKKAV